ncbi:RICIN domain-containing protein [Micromonospora echinospora]|uniref:RICIN domain-containing protein n=1 Tax=Micromonospora echinospora TaxID=1877 RepID=UPI003796D71B
MIRGKRRLVVSVFTAVLLAGAALTASPVGANPLRSTAGESTDRAASEEVPQPAESTSSYRIKNAETGKCLETWAGVWSGAAVFVADCSNSPSQIWVPSGNQLKNSVQGLCLDLYNWNNFDGAPVLVWTCTGAPNQYWNWYGNQIRSGFSFRCLTVYPTSPATGPLVVTANCTGAPNQTWTAVS